MNTTETPTRRLVVAAALTAVVGLGPIVAGYVGTIVDPPRSIAQDECETSGTTDSYSLQCVPNMVPDFTDQLTEAEVAEPGFNAIPGGDRGGGGGGGGGHR